MMTMCLAMQHLCARSQGWVTPIPVDTSVKECSVVLMHLSVTQCYPQLGQEVQIRVEHLSHCLQQPGTVFHGEKREKPSKSSLFPQHKFRGAYDWHTVTVPVDKLSVSARKPGFVFSSHTPPVERLSRSQKYPGRVFHSDKPLVHRVGEAIPTALNPKVICKRVAAAQPCANVSVKTMFTCKVCKVAKRIESTCAAIKRHVEHKHGMYTCRNVHCVAGFKSQSGRDIHEAVHMPKKRVCLKCSAVFQHRYVLQRHMVLRETHPSFKCDKCAKKYFCKQDLKEHLMTAHGGAKFSCAQCAYCGKSACALKQHELVHKGPSMRCL